MSPYTIPANTEGSLCLQRLITPRRMTVTTQRFVWSVNTMEIKGNMNNKNLFIYFFQVVHPKTDGQRERLQGVAKNCLLFKTLDDSQLIEVIDAMFEKKVESGEFLIREGDDGDFFYIIEEGTYNAMKEDKETKEDKVVFTYVNEGNFGELALLYNMPRAASVQVCQTFKWNCLYWIEIFQSILGNHRRVSVGHGQTNIQEDCPQECIPKAEDVRVLLRKCSLVRESWGTCVLRIPL